MPGKIKSKAEFRFLMANKPKLGRELKGNQSLKGLPEYVDPSAFKPASRGGMK